MNFATTKITMDEELVNSIQGKMEEIPGFVNFKHYEDDIDNKGSEVGYMSRKMFKGQLEHDLYDRISENENPKKVLTELVMEKKLKEYANYKQKYLYKPDAHKYFDKKSKDLSTNDSFDQLENRCGWFKFNVLNEQEYNASHNFAEIASYGGETFTNRFRILHYFGKNSVEEILEGLRNDGSTYAKELYEN